MYSVIFPVSHLTCSKEEFLCEIVNITKVFPGVARSIECGGNLCRPENHSLFGQTQVSSPCFHTFGIFPVQSD